MRRVLILCVCLGALLPVGCRPALHVPPLPPVPPQAEWPLGTVLVSRNTDPKLNTSPGIENHLAIYVGGGQIVESQKDQGGVISTPFETYLARDYIWFPMFPIDGLTGVRAATQAKTLIGMPYSELSSLLLVDPKDAPGLNCVSVVRVSYVTALGHPLPLLQKPDDILKMTDVFTRKWAYSEPLKKAG